jgi:CO/xanthine dehydrogenase Mo-binding subunit|tara:strand:- start:321 stop:2579 length:2259 start_codon:yes stop_codon:yes gene_type:complete
VTIGFSHYRIDAIGKVIGTAMYPGDLTPDGLLHAKVVLSGRPHARMLSLDLSSAEAVPGVVAIFTAKDVPVNEHGSQIVDKPVLVGLNSTGRSRIPAEVSRWEGDQVAIIIAETEEAAAEARDLIQIEWEDLALIADIQTAMLDDCLVHPENDKQSNAYLHAKIRKGDMDAGWAAADVIVDSEYELPCQEHAFLQPEAALSYIDGAGQVTVEIAGQWTHQDQKEIAHALDLPLEQVRVVYPAIGGSFGGREDVTLQIVMALASWRLHSHGESRPIRAIWTREESIIGHPKRHRMYVTTRWGATNAGKITAIEAQVYLDSGAYTCTSNKVLGNANLYVPGPYEVPNAHIDSYGVYTNNVPGGAFRGFGAPQGAFAAECQMNKLAAALGIDPVELRLKNVLREGSEGITQAVLPSGVSLPEVIETCAAEGQWGSEQANGHNSNPKLFKSIQSLPPDSATTRHGRGFACAYKNVGFSFGYRENCEASLELHGKAEIERVVLRHAGADVGQGAHTVLQQMAAESVGVATERVELIVSDTAHAGDSGSAAASRLTWMAGNAILGAAEKALEAWRREDRPASGHFRYLAPPTEALDPDTGTAFPCFTYGYVAECVDLTVDIDTGQINVERVVCANDVGKAINPNLIEGQIEGGVVQAYGYAVTENLQLQDGRILNPRLSTYLIPGILDIPERVDSVIMEIPDPEGPWGLRGMAEMPLIPLAPAITAALHNATGIWFEEIPLSPDRVVAKLREHGIGVD